MLQERQPASLIVMIQKPCRHTMGFTGLAVICVLLFFRRADLSIATQEQAYQSGLETVLTLTTYEAEKCNKDTICFWCRILRHVKGKHIYSLTIM